MRGNATLRPNEFDDKVLEFAVRGPSMMPRLLVDP